MRPILITATALILAAGACSSDDTATPSTPNAGTADAEPTETAPDTPPPDTGRPDTGPPDTEPAATEPTDTTPDTTPPDTAPPLEPVESVGLGPYDVGVQTITITDVERDRPLTVDV